MGIYTEFYNLGMDEKTKKPEGTITYDVVDENNKTVLSQTEAICEYSERLGISGDGGEETAAEVAATGQIHAEVKGDGQT